MAKEQKNKTVQELEAPVIDLKVNYGDVDTDPHHERPMGREYPKSRHTMPEKQLFEFAEYRAQEAEKIGYSNYSYWKASGPTF